MKTTKTKAKKVVPQKRVVSPKNNSSVLALTVVLVIVTIVLLSFISYKAMKSKKVVIDMGKYVLINEGNKNTINPGLMELPTTPPNVTPPTVRPEIK